MINLVQEFNLKFGLPDGGADVMSNNLYTQDYRLKFLQEELDELREALVAGDRVAAFDALLDLVYVAHGTALYMGISAAQWEFGMEAVHAANMRKVRVAHPSESKRNNSADLRKPDGWVGPEATLQRILSC